MLYRKVLETANTGKGNVRRRSVSTLDIDSWVSLFSGAIRSAKIFDISNVANYMFNDTDDYTYRDFAVCSPPFDEMWMEYRLPKKILLFGRWGVLPEELAGVPMGFLISSFSYKDKEFDHTVSILAPTLDLVTTEDAGWVIRIAMFLHARDEYQAFAEPALFMALDKFGNIIPTNDGGMGKYVTPRSFAVELWDQNPDWHGVTDLDTFTGYTLNSYVFPVIMSLSFLNCKNVSVSSVTSKPKRRKVKTFKKKRRKRKIPAVKVHTLDVRPLREIHHGSGVSKEGSKRSLHICRGHFRDYREGGGLFGKHHGVFWVPAHVKGRKSVGEVKKDYRVHPS